MKAPSAVSRPYTIAIFRRDLVAALTVAAISLPQGMAYALLAGVDPRYGLYSAILVTLVASIFGSSSHLINGPTSAISLVVFSALAMFDPDQRVEAAEAMFMLGAMVGAIQIFIAVFRLGDLTRYISESVILGFMAAAAALLAIGQISNAIGLKDKGTGTQHVLYRLWLTVTSGDAANPKAIVASVTALVLAVLLRKIVRRYSLPQFDMLTVLIAVALGAYAAGWTVPGLDGKTAIGVAGTVPSSLPTPHIPTVQLKWAWDLTTDAFAIAFLGLLEALAIAKAIANQTRQPLDYNRQILAEGLANLAGGFFQCLPGSGSLSRSAINFQAGAMTRFSGILTALLVAVAVLALAPLARFVPKPALAALLLLTAARLVDFKRLSYTLRASRMDAGVVIATGLSAIAFGLDISILIGVAMSIILFVPRAAKLNVTELIVDDEAIVRAKQPSDSRSNDMLIYDLEGELFFGAAPELENAFHSIRRQADANQIKVVLLRLKRVRNPDVVSLELIEHFIKTSQNAGIEVWLAGLRPDLLAAFRRLAFFDWLPEQRLFPHGTHDYSATLSAIAAIRARFVVRDTSARKQLYYVV
ncbi:SulP family inorganic anion transporter [Beijerinckia sp. L45]|uniref:SulP family inorganic anion transporter n=1 Tax=Beijerinckia sp. L45 TaxID=1641855 RepID=UPI00131B9D35|nr:SulP family inorganic anion transporter [Beijerinckia sp. L45]